jgi:hypothetical protein
MATISPQLKVKATAGILPHQAMGLAAILRQIITTNKLNITKILSYLLFYPHDDVHLHHLSYLLDKPHHKHNVQLHHPSQEPHLLHLI